MRKIEKNRVLSIVMPELAKEWHPTKNKDLKPNQVTVGSGRKVWWQCSNHNNHEWEASINNRVRGTGCPICSNKQVLEGFNDLTTVNPDLYKEWHPTKNKDLKPTQVTAGSDKKVWWQCSKYSNHEWEAYVYERTKGTNCPICSGQQVLEGFNDLVTISPEIAKEWHPIKNKDLKPAQVTSGSNKKVWWQCSKYSNHEWEAIVNTRTKGTNCPICSGQQVLKGFNDLSSINPELAKEWHPTKNKGLKPTQVTARSNKKVWWQCSKYSNHEWCTSTYNREVIGANCPICSGKQVLEGFNDLVTISPEIAKEWHPTKNKDLKPTQVTSGSNKKAWWQCSKHSNHEWEAIINNRTKGTNCPICSNLQILKGFNDLPTTHPELLEEWHTTKNMDLKPSDIVAGSKQKIWWQCSVNNSHEWCVSVVNRSNGSGCPYCSSSNKTSKVEQSLFYYLSKVFDDVYNRYCFDINGKKIEVDIFIPKLNLSIEYDGVYWHKDKMKKDTEKSEILKEITTLIRIREKGLSKIDANENIQLESDVFNYYNNATEAVSKVLEFIKVNFNDKYLSNKIDSINVDIYNDRLEILELFKTNFRKTSLLFVNPELAKEWHPTKNGTLEPMYFSSSSNDKVWWQCSNHSDHEWEATVNNRTNGRGCPICANQQVLEGFNDLATINPELAKEWHPAKNKELKPTQVTVNSSKKVWWQCSKHRNHEWQSNISNRSRLGRGCPICANQQVLEGFNDLATINPELAKEWHPTKNKGLNPTQVTASSNIKVWWQCSKYSNHNWEVSINSRTNNRGCPICSGKQVLEGSNDLATVNPELAKEWHPTKNGDLKPTHVTAGSGRKVWWQCSEYENHEWESGIVNRSNGSGCLICSGKRVLKGVNDLATVNPELAKEWHPTKNSDLKPTHVTAGSGRKVWWQCSEYENHEWEASVDARNRGRKCCPYCKKNSNK